MVEYLLSKEYSLRIQRRYSNELHPKTGEPEKDYNRFPRGFQAAFGEKYEYTELPYPGNLEIL